MSVQRSHLTKEVSHASRVPINKESEYQCTDCTSRVTVDPTTGEEYGHRSACIHKLMNLPGGVDPIELVCEECDKTYPAHPNAKGTRKYCSTQCKRENLFEERDCDHCGTHFNPKHRDQKYCSQECSNEARRDASQARDSSGRFQTH
jgi:hypothetical protein